VAERLEQFCGCSRSIAALGVDVHTVGVMIEHTDAQRRDASADFLHEGSCRRRCDDTIADTGTMHGIEQRRGVVHGV